MRLILKYMGPQPLLENFQSSIVYLKVGRMKTCEFLPSNLFYHTPHNVEMYLMMNESEVGGSQQQTILPCQVRMALGTKLKQKSPLDLKTNFCFKIVFMKSQNLGPYTLKSHHNHHQNEVFVPLSL